MKRVFLILTAISVAACGSETAPDVDAGSIDTPATSSAGTSDVAVERELGEYQLTMDDVQRWYDAQRAIYEASADPDVARRVTIEADNPSFDDLVRHGESVPEVRRATEQAGLSVREHVMITVALMQAAALADVVDSGVSRDEAVAQIGGNPANIDFYRQNRAELERMQAELSEMEPQHTDVYDDYE